MKISRKHFWLVLGIETASLVLLAVWVLLQLDRLFQPLGIVVAVLIVVGGDIAVALLLQRLAPTVITFAPGETPGQTALVIAGFDRNVAGEVSVNGERWKARCHPECSLIPGDRVIITAREGLTLVVRRAPDR